MGNLMNDFNKSQKYLKLGDGDAFDGTYVKWEKVKNSFGGDSWRFTLEREDGTRIDWDTANYDAIQTFDNLLDNGLKKGSRIKIVCHVIGQTKDGKNKYKYDISEETPF